MDSGSSKVFNTELHDLATLFLHVYPKELKADLKEKSVHALSQHLHLQRPKGEATQAGVDGRTDTVRCTCKMHYYYPALKKF